MSSGPSLSTRRFYVVQQTPGTAQYTIVDGFDFAYNITDVPDGPTDNTSVLTASGRDNIQLTGPNQGSSGQAIYLGRTAAEGDIFTFAGGQVSLLSNNTYANGTQLTLLTGETTLCFGAATLIRTSRGEVPVEDLAIGDLAVTSSGKLRPIRWIGSRRIDCRRHPRPEQAQPIRIRANALGENRPARDLVVSPGHAIALDVLGEVLIPAVVLVNGSTIVQEDVDSITYWHIELDSHDLLLAEGQAAESYLDMGNRGFFADGTVIDLAAVPDADEAIARTHVDFCRPFHDGGALVDVVQAQLRQRAVALGWSLVSSDTWADVQLEVDGAIVRPQTSGLTAYFVLPADAEDVWLVSPTSVPSHVSTNPDGRALGLCLAGLSFTDEASVMRTVPLNDPLLCIGFHNLSPDHRWTAGRARLPTALLAGLSGPVLLRLDLSSPSLPRWIGPEAKSAVFEPLHTASHLHRFEAA